MAFSGSVFGRRQHDQAMVLHDRGCVVQGGVIDIGESAGRFATAGQTIPFKSEQVDRPDAVPFSNPNEGASDVPM